MAVLVVVLSGSKSAISGGMVASTGTKGVPNSVPANSPVAGVVAIEFATAALKATPEMCPAP